MLSSNSMISFLNPDEYLLFMKKLRISPNWRIEKGILNTRGKKIEKKSYVYTLTKVFSEKKLFYRKVSIAEIVSWLDGFVIITRLLRHLKANVDIGVYSKLEIYMEYKIEMSKNRRIDYVFKYENRLLLVELRLSDRFPNLTNVWQKKELELIIYKELLSNYIPPNIEVIIYALVFMPEYDLNTEIYKNSEYNENNVSHLANYILKYLFKN